MIDLTEAADPKAVLIENVRGLLDKRFDDYRDRIEDAFEDLGYEHMGWRLLNASDYGVPQLRPRIAMVALRPEVAAHFVWPEAYADEPPSVGEALVGQMGSQGWKGAASWAAQADGIAPTLVGGSKKHGGPGSWPNSGEAGLGGVGRKRAYDRRKPPRA